MRDLPGPDAERLAVSVVIPVRNAENFLEKCLDSVARSRPSEVIVVDGCSTDRTVEIARRFDVRLLSDGGAGVASARMMGVRVAREPLVALVDSDVVLRDGALAALLSEFMSGGFDALQAGLASVSGPGYWGRALASHHNTGRSRHWFGLAATVCKREVLIECPLDARFVSGEDIDLRWRLSQAGFRIGVSGRTFVTHRFGDSFEFARDQFRADGAGLARMAVTHRGGPALFLLPAAATLRGICVTTARARPQFVPYYLAYGAFNYASMVGTMWAIARGRMPRRRSL